MQNEIFTDLHGNQYPYDGQVPIAWRISGYVVVRRGDTILCVKQKYSDKYELPGGGIESRESLIEGVSREFQEEVGSSVIISNSEPFHVYQSRFYNPDQEPYFFNSLALFFTGASDLELPDSAEGFPNRAWINIKDIEDLLQGMHMRAIKQFLK